MPKPSEWRALTYLKRARLIRRTMRRQPSGKWNKGDRRDLTMASRDTEEETLKKTLLIGALAFAASTIAQTAMAAEFYVVRDTTTKKCTVVDTKPTTTTTTIVDNGTFKTKTEAEAGIRTMKVCTEN